MLARASTAQAPPPSLLRSPSWPGPWSWPKLQSRRGTKSPIILSPWASRASRRLAWPMNHRWLRFSSPLKDGAASFHWQLFALHPGPGYPRQTRVCICRRLGMSVPESGAGWTERLQDERSLTLILKQQTPEIPSGEHEIVNRICPIREIHAVSRLEPFLLITRTICLQGPSVMPSTITTNILSFIIISFTGIRALQLACRAKHVP